MIFLLVVTFFNQLKAEGDQDLCGFQQRVFAGANKLHSRGQYLLSTFQYHLFFGSKCSGLDEKARVNFSLSMARLGEISEVLEQYRYLKNQKSKNSQVLKELIALETNDLQFTKVRQFNQIITHPDSYNTDDIELLKLIDSYKKNKIRKSPILAGALSTLLPGAGQVYNGAYQSAIISLLLNSIFLWSTLEFKNKGLDGPAVASGMVFSVTYMGNIMNAVRGSNKLNEMGSSQDRDNLKKFIFPLLQMQF